ncbi:MAG: hypothetical protein KA444_07045 [Bacteroidia bacterium]|nr:hypothetical protein [Bacteroidia bacterium]
MIRFLSHREIDKNRWDECIDQSTEALVYANSWYLDLVSPNWNALVADDYTAVFPLTWRKKFSFNYLFQPIFTQQLGLFISKENPENNLGNFLNKIPESYKLIEVQVNQFNSSFPVPKPFRSSKRFTYVLNLSSDSDTLKQNISSNTRRNIQKFEKSGMSIIRNPNIDEIVKLFRMNTGKEVSNFSNLDYAIFGSLCSEAKRRNLITTVGATDSNRKLQAGIVFLHTHSGFILLFSGVSTEGKSTGAMSAMISSFIMEHAGTERTLDFEGSMDPGLARFYKSFGSSEVVYLQIRNNRLPAPIRWLKN